MQKLKGEIDRHLFEIALQAAIGGRVVARETISAVRKNFSAAASSRKPITTLTRLSHDPLCGNFFSSVGKRARARRDDVTGRKTASVWARTADRGSSPSRRARPWARSNVNASARTAAALIAATSPKSRASGQAAT